LFVCENTCLSVWNTCLSVGTPACLRECLFFCGNTCMSVGTLICLCGTSVCLWGTLICLWERFLPLGMLVCGNACKQNILNQKLSFFKDLFIVLTFPQCTKIHFCSLKTKGTCWKLTSMALQIATPFQCCPLLSMAMKKVLFCCECFDAI
jgi:hypothetical protein